MLQVRCELLSPVVRGPNSGNIMGLWRDLCRCRKAAVLTSIVLHARVVRDSLRPEAEAQDVPGVRTVPDQKGSVWFPFQLHLGVLPVHGSPVPAALQQNPGSRR